MTKTVFNNGDIVYHPKYGKCKVGEASGGYPYIVPYSSGEGFYTEITYLSFEPWSAPCHERPLEDGVYIVGYRDIPQPLVRARFNGQWYLVDKKYKVIGEPITVDCKVEIIEKLNR